VRCGQCGALVGEGYRFCDMVGFTPLSEARDPEAVRELLSEYFSVARTVVTRYGGVVEKFIGAAVSGVASVASRCSTGPMLLSTANASTPKPQRRA
jgi:class 3 adenylate cyclase